MNSYYADAVPTQKVIGDQGNSYYSNDLKVVVEVKAVEVTGYIYSLVYSTIII